MNFNSRNINRPSRILNFKSKSYKFSLDIFDNAQSGMFALLDLECISREPSAKKFLGDFVQPSKRAILVKCYYYYYYSSYSYCTDDAKKKIQFYYLKIIFFKSCDTFIHNIILHQ